MSVAAWLGDDPKAKPAPATGTSSATANPFPRECVDFHGFDRYSFEAESVKLSVACPKEAAAGKSWRWRSIFWSRTSNTAGRITLMDLELVKQGDHVVMRPGNVSGHPSGNAAMDAAYRYLTAEHGASEKTAMGSMSREALALFRWASANPEKVASIYVDNGVCNVKSWPGGKVVHGTDSNAKGSPKDWALRKETYGLQSDQEVRAAKVSPIDWLKPLAKGGVPILLASGTQDGSGTQDATVPYEENAAVGKEQYETLGGSANVVLKDKGHHPHGFKDTSSVIEFNKKYSAKKQAHLDWCFCDV